MRALTENKWHVYGPSDLHHSKTVRVRAPTPDALPLTRQHYLRWGLCVHSASSTASHGLHEQGGMRTMQCSLPVPMRPLCPSVLRIYEHDEVSHSPSCVPAEQPRRVSYPLCPPHAHAPWIHVNNAWSLDWRISYQCPFVALRDVGSTDCN